MKRFGMRTNICRRSFSGFSFSNGSNKFSTSCSRSSISGSSGSLWQRRFSTHEAHLNGSATESNVKPTPVAKGTLICLFPPKLAEMAWSSPSSAVGPIQLNATTQILTTEVRRTLRDAKTRKILREKMDLKFNVAPTGRAHTAAAEAREYAQKLSETQ